MHGQTVKSNRQKIKFSCSLAFHFSLFTFYLLLKNFCLCIIFLALSSLSASAQFGTSMGSTIQLIGMVQVEPGANVLTLDVKDTEIRFQAQSVIGADRDFSLPRFLAELRHHSPSMTIQGPEHLLDLLLEEKPNKRALKLSGIYYHDARRFLVNKIISVSDSNKPQF